MAGWIKYLLMTEQKKSDFKPDTEEGPLQMFSTVSTFWHVAYVQFYTFVKYMHFPYLTSKKKTSVDHE